MCKTHFRRRLALLREHKSSLLHDDRAEEPGWEACISGGGMHDDF
jgi:hypothetical protein